jgi:hypothetical protein
MRPTPGNTEAPLSGTPVVGNCNVDMPFAGAPVCIMVDGSPSPCNALLVSCGRSSAELETLGFEVVPASFPARPSVAPTSFPATPSAAICGVPAMEANIFMGGGMTSLEAVGFGGRVDCKLDAWLPFGLAKIGA